MWQRDGLDKGGDDLELFVSVFVFGMYIIVALVSMRIKLSFLFKFRIVICGFTVI